MVFRHFDLFQRYSEISLRVSSLPTHLGEAPVLEWELFSYQRFVITYIFQGGHPLKSSPILSQQGLNPLFPSSKLFQIREEYPDRIMNTFSVIPSPKVFPTHSNCTLCIRVKEQCRASVVSNLLLFCGFLATHSTRSLGFKLFS